MSWKAVSYIKYAKWWLKTFLIFIFSITSKFSPHEVSENFAERYIRSKFQSCPNGLKLKIQSLLTLLIPKTFSLSILDQNCGSLFTKLKPIKGTLLSYVRLLSKLLQFWCKIDQLSNFGIRKVRRLWIFNFSPFGQLWNFDLM